MNESSPVQNIQAATEALEAVIADRSVLDLLAEPDRIRFLQAAGDVFCPDVAKRREVADLHGRVALLIGGRVKIGYQAGIKLLRSGAALVVTTRFPRDAALRYAREPDFDDWGDRLEIFGLDLRHTPSVEAFCH